MDTEYSFFCRMDPPPPQGRGQPRRGQIDEKAASAPHNPPLPPEPQGQRGF